QTSHRQLEARELDMSQKDTHAAVDSELALLWWKDYRLYRWQVNPRYFSIPDDQRRKLPPTVLTCRVDGPTPAVAKRIVDDALAAEAAGGPKGTAYVDARGLTWDKTGDAA